MLTWIPSILWQEIAWLWSIKWSPTINMCLYAVGRPSLGLGRSLDFLFCKYCPGFSYLFFTSNGSISQLLLIHYEMMFLSIINVVWHTQRLQIWWNWFAHWWYCSSVSFGNFTLQILTIVDELHYIQGHVVLVKHMQSLLCMMTYTKF